MGGLQPSPGPPSPLARVLIAAVRAYRWIPKTGVQRCRFHPTCSTYALDALRLHGAVRGTWLTVRRLGRCHPFHPGGIDHVPPARREATARGPALADRHQ